MLVRAQWSGTNKLCCTEPNQEAADEINAEFRMVVDTEKVYDVQSMCVFCGQERTDKGYFLQYLPPHQRFSAYVPAACLELDEAPYEAGNATDPATTPL